MWGHFLHEGWKVASDEQKDIIIKALSNPIRKNIYDLLEAGPLRQHRLAQLLKERLAKIQPGEMEEKIKYGDSALRYHLKPLEEAGLIRSRVEGDSKIIYRALDVRLQVQELETRTTPEEAPHTPEETKEKLKEMFARRRRGVEHY